MLQSLLLHFILISTISIMPGPNPDNTRAKIMLELKTNDGITVRAIADKINVHVKTVKRHIDVLMEGKNPKVRNDKTKYFWIAKQSFREKELHSFFDKLIAADVVNMDFATEVIALIKQKNAGKKKNEPFAKEKEIILSAINNDHQISTQYESRDGGVKKNRALSPIKLNASNNKVECWDSNYNKTTTFNLEKMKGLKEMNGVKRELPQEGVPIVKKDIFGFSDNGNPFELYLNLTEHAKSMLLKQFVQFKSMVKDRGKKTRYHYRIHFKTLYDIQPIARFVVGLLHEVEIDEGCTEAKKKIREYFVKNISQNAEKKLGVKN